MSNPFAVQTVRCAGPGCKQVRSETNHWFVMRMCEVQGGDREMLWKPFPKDGQLEDNDFPVCGEACAQKVFNQNLANAAGKA